MSWRWHCPGLKLGGRFFVLEQRGHSHIPCSPSLHRRPGSSIPFHGITSSCEQPTPTESSAPFPLIDLPATSDLCSTSSQLHHRLRTVKMDESKPKNGEEAKVEPLKMGLNVMAQGKRKMAIKDVPTAVTLFGEACRLISEANGTFSLESGDAHLWYGKSLLEQSRCDLSIFESAGANATKSGDEDEDDEEEMEEGDEDGEEESTDKEAETTEIETKDTKSATTETEQVSDKVDGDLDSKSETNAGDEKSAVPSKMEEGDNVAEPSSTTTSNLEEQEEDLNIPSPKAGLSSNQSKVVDSEMPSTSAGVAADPDATLPEDELPNLELAWEVLEVAKVAFIKCVEEKQNANVEGEQENNETDKTDMEKKADLDKDLKDYKARLANTYLLLGEVATESEQYPVAVTEINKAMEILQEIEEFDSREIAMCEFQLGIAYSFDKKFEEAIGYFKKSCDLISIRVENLKKKLELMETGEKNEAGLSESKPEAEAVGQLPGEDVKAKIETEIEELKALLPELQEKISDTLDAQKEALRVSEEEKQEKEILLRNSPVKNPNPVAVNDISHLVKKKKKAEDFPEDEPAGPPSKKVCTEADSSTICANTTNGSNGGGNKETANGVE